MCLNWRACICRFFLLFRKLSVTFSIFHHNGTICFFRRTSQGHLPKLLKVSDNCRKAVYVADISRTKQTSITFKLFWKQWQETRVGWLVAWNKKREEKTSIALESKMAQFNSPGICFTHYPGALRIALEQNPSFQRCPRLRKTAAARQLDCKFSE